LKLINLKALTETKMLSLINYREPMLVRIGVNLSI